MKITSLFSAAVILLLASAAHAQQDVNKQVRVKIKEIRMEHQYTPDFKPQGVTEKRWRPKQWLEFDGEIAIDLANDLGGKDGTYPALEFKYYIGMNQKTKEGKTIVLTGTVNYLNVPASEPSHVLAYVTPATLKRVMLKDNAGKADVGAYGAEVRAGGQVVVVSSSNGKPWWVDASNQPDSTKFEFQDGAVISKAKSPFASLWGDYDLQAEAK